MLQEINNNLINENFIFSKISDCKYKISLLSNYLMNSFNVINGSIYIKIILENIIGKLGL